MPRRRLPPNVRAHGCGFIAVVQVEGRRHYSRTFDTPEKAAAYARAFREASVPDVAWTLQDAFHATIEELRLLQRSPATERFYAGHWPQLAAHFGAGRPIVEIDAAMVRGYVAELVGRGLATGTVHKRAGMLRRILGVAVEAGALQNSPATRLRLPQLRQRRFDALSGERVAQVVDRIRSWPISPRARTKARLERDADVVAILYLTGLRRAELARLRPEDIDLEHARLWVLGKTENREMPLSVAAREVLVRLLASATPGRPLVGSAAQVAAILFRWRRRLGVRELSAHVLRHSFATSLARAGVSPYVLRDLMGHRHLQQTMRYYHSQGDQNREAVEKLQLPPPPQPGAAPHGARGPGTGSRSGPAATR